MILIPTEWGMCGWRYYDSIGNKHCSKNLAAIKDTICLLTINLKPKEYLSFKYVKLSKLSIWRMRIIKFILVQCLRYFSPEVSDKVIQISLKMFKLS